MQYYSTKHQVPPVNFAEAVLKGLPDDNGLFMPTAIPTAHEVVAKYTAQPQHTFSELAYDIAVKFLSPTFTDQEIREIVTTAFPFHAPVVTLDAQHHVLELFHGHTLAFKDFGARFMAQVMSRLVAKSQEPLHILVATSGDTGSAVAHGFLGVPNIHVTVLYPSGKVSERQEKQFATLGQNITALEIAGTFDDCQALVKQAFLDTDLTKKLRLSSANSINISRLIPQAFYYFSAYFQVHHLNQPVVFVVPSGNFGNLTAGLFAQRMGLPIHQFVAATNANDVVPAYLQSGNFQPHASIQTISNAMDVGNPSNFARMQDLFQNNLAAMQKNVVGYSFDDESTRKAIATVKNKYNYTIEPHGAVGFLALEAYLQTHPQTTGIVLETAHPVKFYEVVEEVTGETVPVPERLQVWLDKPKLSIPLSKDFAGFKEFLMKNF